MVKVINPFHNIIISEYMKENIGRNTINVIKEGIKEHIPERNLMEVKNVRKA